MRAVTYDGCVAVCRWAGVAVRRRVEVPVEVGGLTG